MYTREGCRGGRENFKWNDIKEQDFKDREQYLGASTKVGLMGKFARYYVNDWYAKKRDTATSIEEERGTVQKFEDELMQEALGLKPKKLLLAKKQLTEEEIKEYLKPEAEKTSQTHGSCLSNHALAGPQRKTAADAEGNEVEAHVLLADSRIQGLGFAAHRNAALEKYKVQAFGSESKLEGIKGEAMKGEIKSEIKSEIKNEPITDTDRMTLGGASSSSGSGYKKEEQDAAPKKEEPEIKHEPPEAPPSKRRRETEEDEDEDEEAAEAKKRRKAEKKSKKNKKAEKKAKKKVKKALKKEKKAAKLAAKLEGRGRNHKSSDSSSSSS